MRLGLNLLAVLLPDAEILITLAYVGASELLLQPGWPMK